MLTANQQPNQSVVNDVKCDCGRTIFDGATGVLKSRCVKVFEQEALCRCKQWVKLSLAVAE